MSPIHQVVDVRVKGPTRYFATAEAERQHVESMQAARAAIPSSVLYVVAPGECVIGRGGKRFEAGTPIGPDDISDDVGYPAEGRASWRVLADLVYEERVLENYQYVPPDRAA